MSRTGGSLAAVAFSALGIAISPPRAAAVDATYTVIDELSSTVASLYGVAMNESGQVAYIMPGDNGEGLNAIWTNLSGTPELLLEPTVENHYKAILEVDINDDGSIVFTATATPPGGGTTLRGLFAVPRDGNGALDPASADAHTDFILSEPAIAGTGRAGVSNFFGFDLGESGNVFANGSEIGNVQFHIYAGNVAVLGDTDGVEFAATSGTRFGSPAIDANDVLVAHVFTIGGLPGDIIVTRGHPTGTALESDDVPFEPEIQGRGGVADDGTILFTGLFRESAEFPYGLYSKHIDDPVLATLKRHGATNSAYDFAPLQPSINQHGHVAFRAQLDDGRGGIFVGPDPVRDAVLVSGHSFQGSSLVIGEFTVAVQALSQLNNADQVAMIVHLADGRVLVVRAELSNFPDPECVGAQCVAEPQVQATINSMNMMTGSPVSASQTIDTPPTAFSISFDHRFLSQTGTLDVRLGGQTLGTITEPHTVDETIESASFLVDQPFLLGQSGLTLAFVLDGETGSWVQVSSISLDDLPAGFDAGLENADFATGDFTGWTLDSSEGGDIELVAFDVPAPVGATTTTLPGTTTTTLPQAGGCGDPSALTLGGDTPARVVSPTDALFVLRAAVNLEVCELCVCDVDGSGSVAPSDALIVLRAAVGQNVLFNCPPCT